MTEQTQQQTSTSGSSHRLQRNLVIWVGVILLIVLLVAGGGVLFFTFLTEQQAWQGRQAEAARSAGEKVSAFLQSVETSLKLIGSVDATYLETQPQMMHDLLQQTPAFQEIIRVNQKGQKIASAYQDNPLLANLFTIPQSDWFITTASGQTYLGRVEIAMNDQPYLIIAVPAANGGAVAARLKMNVLWDVVADIRFGEQGHAYVINDNGDVVAHTKQDIVLANTNLKERPEVIEIFNTPGKVWSGGYTNFEGNSVVGATAPIPGTSWIVITELPSSEAFATTRMASLFLALGTLVIEVLLIFAASKILAYQVFKPLQELQLGAARIGQGDFNYHVNIIRHDEIGEVAQAFNRMAVRLQDLYNNLQRRTQRLEIIASLSERLNPILNLDQLMAEVVNQVKESFSYYHAHIYLFDDTRERLVVAAGTGQAGLEMKTEGYHIPANAPTSLVARAARTAEIVNVDDVRQATDWLPNPLLPNTCSEIAVPIILEEQVVGVLDVQEDKIAGFDEGDGNLLRSLANQVAVAIRNTRLFAEVQTTLSEVRVIQQQYLEQSWQKAKEMTGGGQYVYVKPTAPPPDEVELQAIAEINRQALTQGRPVTATADDNLTGKSLAVPIDLRNNTIGVLQLHSKSDKIQPWTEEDLTLVETIADQFAQAAENLRLFEETRLRAGREQTIRQITERMRSAADLDELIKIAAEELGQHLSAKYALVKLGVGSSVPNSNGHTNGQDED